MTNNPWESIELSDYETRGRIYLSGHKGDLAFSVCEQVAHVL